VSEAGCPREMLRVIPAKAGTGLSNGGTDSGRDTTLPAEVPAFAGMTQAS
jgi:hypothetical protein